jgi:hypothetical protein
LDLDPNNPSNNGYKNEDFIVWMRTAAMPTFRKLYRKLISNGSNTFQNGLPQGNYILSINYSNNFFIYFCFFSERISFFQDYPVSSFNGRKQFIISTTSWMGGKNPFLGWAYIVVGIICIIAFVAFFVLHKTWKT